LRMSIQAIVKRKRKVSRGRGFSRGELKEVGLNCTESLDMGIPVDVKRSSKHQENIDALQTYLKTIKPKTTKTEIKEKIVELTEVKGIGPKSAEKLQKAGITNANTLITTKPETIAEILGTSIDRASNFIQNASSKLSEE